MLRGLSRGNCYTVQILDPRIDPRAFDLVIAPRHDGIDAPNVIRSIGSLNPVDPRWLAEARERFARFAALPSPRTAVLIGATNSAQRLDDRYFDALLDLLRDGHGGGSFLVSVSRRTPDDVALKLRAAFVAFPGVFFGGDGDGENPYAGFLAWADCLVVTPDSVNMLSEACATGKPVYTFAPQPITGKLAEFHGALRDSGRLRVLGEPAQNPLPPPLAETHEIAALVRARWQATRR
jgi:mitochondrial fission protein ELM1